MPKTIASEQIAVGSPPSSPHLIHLIFLQDAETSVELRAQKTPFFFFFKIHITKRNALCDHHKVCTGQYMNMLVSLMDITTTAEQCLVLYDRRFEKKNILGMHWLYRTHATQKIKRVVAAQKALCVTLLVRMRVR